MQLDKTRFARLKLSAVAGLALLCALCLSRAEAFAQSSSFYVHGDSNAGASLYQFHDFYNSYIDQLYTSGTAPQAYWKWDYSPAQVEGQIGSEYEPNKIAGGLNVGKGVSIPSMGSVSASQVPGTEPGVEATAKEVGALPEYVTPGLHGILHEAAGALAKMNMPAGEGSSLGDYVSGLGAESLGTDPMGMDSVLSGGGLGSGLENAP